MISAASSQIQATIGEKYPLKNPDGSLILREGKTVPDYGLTQAIFMGCVAGCLLICSKSINNYLIIDLCSFCVYSYHIYYYLLIVAVGKEERNKDFMDNLLEDEHGNAIGADDIENYRLEHGSAGIKDKQPTEHVENVVTEDKTQEQQTK